MKSFANGVAETEDTVALLVSAWIEIVGYSLGTVDRLVALLVSAWIEIASPTEEAV